MTNITKFFIYNSINIYSLFILAIMFFQAIKLLKTKDKFQGIIWVEIISCLFFIILADILSWVIIINKSNTMIIISKISNCFVFTFTSFFTVRTVLFFNYTVNFSKSSYCKLKKFFYPIIIINFILSILSIFFNIYFYYDINGNYFIGNYYYISICLIFLPLLYGFFIMISKYKKIKDIISTLLLGFLCPILFIMVHIFLNLPVSILFSSIVLSAIIFNTLLINNDFNVDYLTKLKNKRGIDRYFSQLPNTVNDYLIVIYIDIDNFKKINDDFGHFEGDFVLSLFSSYLFKAVNIRDLIARFGGDEFLIATRCNNEKNYKKIIKNILNKTNKFNESNKKPYKISFSYGVSITKPNTPINKEKIIKQADQNMYKFKQVKKTEEKNNLKI